MRNNNIVTVHVGRLGSIGEKVLPEISGDNKNMANYDGGEISKEDESGTGSGKKFQIFAAMGSNLGSFAYGITLCWSATVIPSLRKDEDFGGISDTQASWISSVLTLGALAFCIPAGILADNVGRRRTMILVSIPFSAACILLFAAQNFWMIIIGRVITGMCSAVYIFVGPIFVAEISEPSIRGLLVACSDFVGAFGVLFQLIIGGLVSWRYQSLICAVAPLTIAIIMWFVPESPRFLMSKGLDMEASSSMSWFRGTAKDSLVVETELKKLRQHLAEDDERKKGNFCKEIWKPHTRKPMLIGLVLFLFKIMSGMLILIFYRIEIFESAGVKLDPIMSSIIVEIVDVLASIASASVVDRFGRKILMIISEIMMALALAVFGGFFYVKTMDGLWAREYLGWLPLAALVFHTAGYSVGMSQIPSTVMTEILPQRTRAVAASILTACRWLLSFFVTRYFKDLVGIVGDAGGYWIFAVFCFLGAVYIFVFVPETKGKSLEEIQTKLHASSSSHHK